MFRLWLLAREQPGTMMSAAAEAVVSPAISDHATSLLAVEYKVSAQVEAGFEHMYATHPQIDSTVLCGLFRKL
jgi:hypothetical protein